VILGPNASGKSNLFDAIQLLSRLASHDLRMALQDLRGEPLELFRRRPDGEPGTRMSLAVEVLLDHELRDPWGAEVSIKHSRVRYEVEIERRKDGRGTERLFVVKEQALPMIARSDTWTPGGRKPSSKFKASYMRYQRQSPFLATEEGADGKRSFEIHQDGKAGRTRSAEAAEATVLSSITSAEFQHLYALREELRSWRFLQLDPAALHRPSPFNAPDELLPDGSHLAAVLHRIKGETATQPQPAGAIADIAADLAALIPGVVSLSVDEDKKTREYRVDITMRDGPPFSSRVVSDGTLRILALLTVLHDPKRRGLICFEEPENGVHPLRLTSMVRCLKELVSDPTGTDTDTDESEPLFQMIMNSHSPVVLSCLANGEKVYADMVSAVTAQPRTVAAKTRVRPIRDQDRFEFSKDTDSVSVFEVNRYLSTVLSDSSGQ